MTEFGFSWRLCESRPRNVAKEFSWTYFPVREMMMIDDDDDDDEINDRV